MPWHTLLVMLQIKVNGRDFHTFEHRIPVERVCAMHIAGDVSIKTINVIGVRLSAPEAFSFNAWVEINYKP